MPYSSGTYSLPSGNPVVTGTTISSSTTNTTNSDIATALSTCVLKDGTQTITANLPMASHKLTGLSAGTTAGDSVEYGGSPTFTNVTATNVTAASVTTTGATGSLNSINTFGFKNRIINGGMVIDQRNAGASVTPTSDGTYTLDRWKTSLTQSSKFSVQQQTSVVPDGFTYALKVTSLSAFSVGSGDTFSVYQVLEGFNIADLSWGTANAKTVTLSFHVYSSLTGTFGGAIVAPSFGFSYPFSYSVPTANTWTTISVTITGPTSGTFGNTNANGFSVFFGLGSGATFSGTAGAWASGSALTATGATSVVGTSGATFYITGVQLEKGSVATSFDQRAYSQELAMCQRYYWQQINIGNTANLSAGLAYSTTQTGQHYVAFPATMRASPTAATVNASSMWTPTATYPLTGIAAQSSSISQGTLNLTASAAAYITGSVWIPISGVFSFSSEL
jgi:hypothetical protein